MQRRHLLTAAAALPLLACQRPAPELPGGFADTDTLAHGHALRDQLAHMRQCGFDAFAMCVTDFHAHPDARHAQRFAKRRATFRPVRAIGMQAMIDVQCAQSALACRRCPRQRQSSDEYRDVSG